MPSLVITRTIDAPVERVFRTVSDIRNFSRAIRHITKVEFLTDKKVGVGTRFRETRLVGGKEASTELEVTEYDEGEKVRLIADSHGTLWDTVFTVKPSNGGTELTMRMDARAYRLMPKLLNPIVMGLVKKAVESDMDAVKEYCEK